MIDYLIVGRGLAGCFLCQNLIQSGATVRIIDDGRTSASRVAGGLINPITGRRFGYDESYTERFAVAQSTYSNIAGALRLCSVYRVLNSDDEKKHWERKAESLQEVAAEQLLKTEFSSHVGLRLRESDQSVYLRFSNAAVVYTPLVLDYFSTYFSERGVLLNGSFSSTGMDPFAIKHQQLQFRNIVFCEGWAIHRNHFFKDLPFMFAKGQLLTLTFRVDPGLRDIVILNGKFLCPIEGSQYRYGSTYEWNAIDDHVEDNTTSFLENSLRQSVHDDFYTQSAQAGVRPIMSDLKPILGTHHEYPNVHVFNGLGSKGALLAPTLAENMTQFLLWKRSLPADYDLSRFTSLKSTGNDISC